MNSSRHALAVALVTVAACSAETHEGDANADPATSLSPQGKKPKGGGSETDSGTTSETDSGTGDSTGDGTDSSTSSGSESTTDTSSSTSFVDACLLPGMTTATFTPYGTIAATDEGVTSAMALPFSFTFLGTSYSQFWVTSNGELGFGASPGGSPFGDVACALADAKITSPIVFAYAADLRVNLPGGAVCIATTGAAPNRKLVVTWKDMGFYELANDGDSHVTFGATLYEGSHAIELAVHAVDVYSPFLPAEDFVSGKRSVLGLQSGSSAVSHSCREGLAPPGTVFRYAP